MTLYVMKARLFLSAVLLAASTLLIFGLFPVNPPEEQQNNELFDTIEAEKQQQQHHFKSRIVHLDFKGARPKTDFLINEVFPLLESAGATGLLIEYEDSFPYQGRINSASAENSMSKREVEKLVRGAAEYNLEVIPLVQTFGHLEHVLKLEEFSALRESAAFPQSICPSNEDSFGVVTEMIDQVLELHPNASRLHLGCDEVFHLAVCQKCRAKLRKINEERKRNRLIPYRDGRFRLFLDHVARLTEYLKKRRPGIIPLIWDDMLRSIPPAELASLSNVQPVVWTYGEKVKGPSAIDDSVWRKYSGVFPRIWAASAFKGAFGERLLIPPIEKHLRNNLAWTELLNDGNSNSRFEGLILTGWSRYDHFAALCELLPTSIPSLVIILAGIQGTGKVNQILGCPFKVNEAVLANNPQRLLYDLRTCSFPASNVFTAVYDLAKLRSEILKEASSSSSTTTLSLMSPSEGGLTGFGVADGAWMTEFAVNENATSTWRLVEPLRRQKIMLKAVQEVEKRAKIALDEIFERETVDEWIEENVSPLKKAMNASIMTIESLMARTSWPRRSFA